MKRPITERKQIIVALVKQELSRDEAARLLGCTTRTLSTYLKQYIALGTPGLVDHRHSNHFVLTQSQREKIISLKETDRWRSPRNIRDYLDLPIAPISVWRVLRGVGLTHENVKRVKAIVRFEADNPNDLWQTDIMGKITFKYLGDLYLIATIDDHSRFVPSGRWFKNQGKMNVFFVWYESLANWGIPKAMLQEGVSIQSSTEVWSS